MRVAKAEAGRFQDRFKDGRQKTEDAIAEAGKAVTEVFQHMTWRKPAWFGGHSEAEPTRKNSGGLDRVPLAPSLTAPATHLSTTVTPSAGRQATQPTPPVPAAEQNAASEDDAPMRYHFAALERLVAMGLSPQASRAALRHMDEWLVSKAGADEMARAEARARELGEHILHKGDHVRLQGLVKNAAANGNTAVLQTYVAENQRWKVALHDGKAYLLQPKFLHPLLSRPPPQVADSSDIGTREASRQTSEPSEEFSLQAEAAALEDVRREIARTQLLWQEAQQAKEIELLEREELLQRQQDELEAQQRLITERRRTIAIDQARNLAALEQQAVAASPDQGREGRRCTAEFTMSDDLQMVCETGVPTDEVTSEVEDDAEDEEDEVWDMDWSAVGSQARSNPTSPVNRLQESESTESVAQTKIAHTGPRIASAPVAASQQTQVGPNVSSEDRDKMLRKLEEKRELAERHNGEDLTAERVANLTKESMPGAHPALAAKLEQRRLLHEAQEERMAKEDDAI
mmetsp:Transcript_43035/g.67103  ORF Transcript_43035/g.67103 Transcript_43035/m.67103 type:complete len:516 (-) Transcript_43035:94-1641(-)